ncbi:MAG: hypothetical protein E7208_10285 [Clostridium butyricum]|nr:hypothetical protein [Clostridium butyricum]
MYNIKFKGSYKNESQLLDGALLPENAKRINAPTGIAEMNLFAILFMPFIFMINLVIFFSKGFILEFDIVILTICCILVLLVSIIFYMLCAFVSTYMLYNNELEKEVWIHVKSLTIFIHCNGSTSRKRYVLINLLPILLLGLIPNILWAIGIFDLNFYLSYSIMIFCSIFILSNVIQVIKAIKILKQAPKNSMIINHGFKLYWYE